MPSNLTDVTTSYPAQLAAPSDSDSPLASGQLRTVLQQIADRTGFLNAFKKVRDFKFDVTSLDETTAAGPVQLATAEVEAKQGDVVIALFSSSMSHDTAGRQAELQLECSALGAGIPMPGSLKSVEGTAGTQVNRNVTTIGIYQPLVDGFLTITAQGIAIGGGNASFGGASVFSGLLVVVLR